MHRIRCRVDEGGYKTGDASKDEADEETGEGWRMKMVRGWWGQARTLTICVHTRHKYTLQLENLQCNPMHISFTCKRCTHRSQWCEWNWYLLIQRSDYTFNWIIMMPVRDLISGIYIQMRLVVAKLSNYPRVGLNLVCRLGTELNGL